MAAVRGYQSSARAVLSGRADDFTACWNNSPARLRAKLDAVFFHLYGVTDRDDVRYVYSTFPIVEREETTTHGRYRSRDPCLAYMNALAAGDPDAEADL